MNDFALDAHATGMNHDGSVRFGAENQMLAIFYRGTKRDNFASQQNGYPIEKGVDMLEIRQFGEKDSTKREVTPADQIRFPQQWAAYKANREQVQDGTPLDLLFPKNPEVVSTLKANNVHTIQALAAVPDSSSLPFIGEHRAKAKTFIEGIDKGKGFHALEKQLEDAQFRNLELEDRIKALEAKLLSDDSDEKRGPGRPRKQDTGE